jgi:hypothetical protein
MRTITQLTSYVRSQNWICRARSRSRAPPGLSSEQAYSSVGSTPITLRMRLAYLVPSVRKGVTVHRGLVITLFCKPRNEGAKNEIDNSKNN